MTDRFYVVFGAAVRPDGTPSGSLDRRVKSAWATAQNDPQSKLIVTGGQGRYGSPEAEIMRDILVTEGCDPASIITEAESGDTFDSVINCARIIKAESDGEPTAVVCTSSYHALRCQVLFRLVGVTSSSSPVRREWAHLGPAKWMFYWFRDFVALFYDVFLMIVFIMKNK